MWRKYPAAVGCCVETGRGMKARTDTDIRAQLSGWKVVFNRNSMVDHRREMRAMVKRHPFVCRSPSRVLLLVFPPTRHAAVHWSARLHYERGKITEFFLARRWKTFNSDNPRVQWEVHFCENTGLFFKQLFRTRKTSYFLFIFEEASFQSKNHYSWFFNWLKFIGGINLRHFGGLKIYFMRKIYWMCFAVAAC